jgi:hypothetical protein
MNSILDTIKKMLGIEEIAFDTDIIVHINTALMSLNQIGVGPTTCFSITGSTEEWDDFLASTELEMAKSYVYLKVKMLFDPSGSATVQEAMARSITEFEWRLRQQIEKDDVLVIEEEIVDE